LKIHFWVDVHNDIGMGHFIESLTLAKIFRKQGYDIRFLITAYEPAEKILKTEEIEHLHVSTNYDSNIFTNLEIDKSHKLIFVNHRSVNIDSLNQLSRNEWFVAVIDQLGEKEITADLLINSSIVSEWRRYEFNGTRPKCLFGPDYAILRDEFHLIKKNKSIQSKKPSILVTMGGVDRTGVTLKIIRALIQLENIEKYIVIGPGFKYRKELNQIASEIDNSFKLKFNVNNMAELMVRSDIAISSGGNTLYELACTGIPTLVLWEDPHENINANAFSEYGFVQNIGNGLEVSETEIFENTLLLLNSKEKRQEMSKNGKKITDGNGVNKIHEEFCLSLNNKLNFSF
jgi:UDP-2,4-diacetamido-2,4,6-trideoxy-beta-L-altropyranose hydrolase